MKKSTFIFRAFTLMVFLALSSLSFAQSNQYLDFDGIDDHVVVENGESYITNSTQGITMMGWFNSNDLMYGQGMMGFRGGTTEFYLIQIGSGKLECRYKSSTGSLYEYVAPANTIIPQVWQHLAWVFDGSAVKLYVNGNLKGSKPAAGVLNDNTVPFAIGKSLLGGFNFIFGGKADEVSVWKRGLTQTEIQDAMNNELYGNEADLQMYYKFNQGVPGGDNTSITQLITELYAPDRNGDLLNFAMTGQTSNFNGTLDSTYQAISFPQIGNKLNSNPPFTISATSTSGLDVIFNVLSGPATVNGNLVTLTGDTGTVFIEASQPGNSQYDPADPVVNSFQVLDPNLHVPDVELRNPLPGNVYVPSLSEIQLACISSIAYPDLFHVRDVKFKVDGQIIPAQDFYNTHYTAWWMPPGYGSYTLQVISTNNYGASSTRSFTININQSVEDMEVQAVQGVWLNTNISSAVVQAELPSYLGAFDKITATLQVQCPSGGCGEWDRVASVDAKGHDGRWFEIIRYITPYGVPCSHTIDLTDYMSILQGKIAFRVNCGTLDNGYLYNLTLNYRAGNPAHKYSYLTEVWNEIFPFGDYANLQPVDTFYYEYPANAVASKLKLVSTGHGWGDNNTGNAAEFYNATHKIWVNGNSTFNQVNWTDCNPNPDGCQPQNGTWYYDRAGWCPGSIAKWFDFDMSPFVNGNEISLMYKFYSQYVDNCHAHNPGCVTGTTCPDCNDGFNPTLDVACNLVSFADSPIVIVGNNEPAQYIKSKLTVAPNPTGGIFELSASKEETYVNSMLYIYDVTGKLILKAEWNGEKTSFDLSNENKGLYLLKIVNQRHRDLIKLVVN
ncbi:MAG: T9SS type A sorting domain-containing protein [Bacteroidales bacterium]|nr:T9SS type A sorting domain-containing protein [Bacteroidales bacterium]